MHRNLLTTILLAAIGLMLFVPLVNEKISESEAAENATFQYSELLATVQNDNSEVQATLEDHSSALQRIEDSLNRQENALKMQAESTEYQLSRIKDRISDRAAAQSVLNMQSGDQIDPEVVRTVSLDVPEEDKSQISAFVQTVAQSRSSGCNCPDCDCGPNCSCLSQCNCSTCNRPAMSSSGPPMTGVLSGNQSNDIPMRSIPEKDFISSIIDKYYVRRWSLPPGEGVRDHLMRAHGFSAVELKGRSDEELHQLNSAIAEYEESRNPMRSIRTRQNTLAAVSSPVYTSSVASYTSPVTTRVSYSSPVVTSRRVTYSSPVTTTYSSPVYYSSSPAYYSSGPYYGSSGSSSLGFNFGIGFGAGSRCVNGQCW